MATKTRDIENQVESDSEAIFGCPDTNILQYMAEPDASVET